MAKKKAKKATTIEKTEWKITDSRFVAFIDILGFKDLVMRKPHAVIYNQLSKISKTKNFLENFIKENQDNKFSDTEIYTVSFSDSIVIFSKNDNIANFQFFLVAVRWLFAQALKDDIPLKGAFAYGEISLDKKEQIYFGQAIIDAYLLQEDVNYLGIVGHNSIDDYMAKRTKTKDRGILEKFIFEEKTPLKSGHIRHLNINWFEKISKTESDSDKAMSLVIQTITKFNLSVSGSPRRYIDNTLNLFEKINAEKKM